MSSRSAVNPSPEYRQAGASMTRTRTLVTLAMLSAIAFVVMLASKLMPSVMGFLDFDFKDVVICIGAFVFGPLAGAGMVVTVAFLELFTVSTTGIIGFIMNVLATGGFCCTAAVIYKRRHTMMGAIAGLLAGAVVMTVLMLVWNYLITPLYMTGVSRADVAAMLVPIFLPFNLVKAGMNTAATLLLYKPVVTALRGARLIPPSTEADSRRTSGGFLLFSLVLLATFLTAMLVMMGVI